MTSHSNPANERCSLAHSLGKKAHDKIKWRSGGQRQALAITQANSASRIIKRIFWQVFMAKLEFLRWLKNTAGKRALIEIFQTQIS